MIEIEMIATKELFINYTEDYRIISCVPVDFLNTLIKLNKYGNFTISGHGIGFIQLGTPITVRIEPDTNSKYPASYIFVGYGRIKNENNKIVLDKKISYQLLTQFMTAGQADNIMNAEPDFINKIISGNEADINVKNIFNVGDYRLNDYIEKVKKHCGIIPFLPICADWNINDISIIDKLSKVFIDPNSLAEAFNHNPYQIFSDICDYSFPKMDKIIMAKAPQFANSPIRAEYCIVDYLKQSELEGDTKIEVDFLIDCLVEDYPEIENNILDIIKNSKIIHYDENTNYCGLKTTYDAEQHIAIEILNRIKYPTNSNMNWQDFTSIEGFNLTEEQIQILKLANEQSVCMLTGQAGTGKSSSIKALIKMLEANGKSYTMLTPTGIAAKVLKQATGRPASTIHMFLATANEDSMGDFLIIDESSMIGVMLLSALFSMLKENTKIIFVCDNAQLASISAGNIVQNILDSHIVSIATLTKVFRYGVGGIDTIATDTRLGKFGYRRNQFADYKFIDINDNPIEQVFTEYQNLLTKYNKNDILILSPFNKGEVGSLVINNYIQEKTNFNPDTEAIIKLTKQSVPQIMFKIGDKVINTKNNYHATKIEYENNEARIIGECDIMNGDIGIVRWVGIVDNTVAIDIQFDNDLVRFYSSEIINLKLGYCISCHKSQGCQAKAVIVVTAKAHKRMLTRNLLYVACSRAQEQLIEIGDSATINEALDVVETNVRENWLEDLLIIK